MCRGCKRFNHEVIHWNSYSNDQKLRIEQRLRQLLEQVSTGYIEVTDEELLRDRVRQFKVRIDAYRSSAAHAYELLRAGGEQINPLESFGLRPQAAYRTWSVEQLRNAIDQDFWRLSNAHYARYFANR